MPGSHIQILAVKSLKVICFPVDNLWSAAVPATGVALSFAGQQESHRPVKIRRPSSSAGWTAIRCRRGCGMDWGRRQCRWFIMAGGIAVSKLRWLGAHQQQKGGRPTAIAGRPPCHAQTKAAPVVEGGGFWLLPKIICYNAVIVLTGSFCQNAVGPSRTHMRAAYRKREAASGRLIVL